MEGLLAIDRAILLSINGLHFEALDRVMFLISEKWFWGPMYLLLSFQLWRTFGIRGFLAGALVIGAVILFSDQMASGVLKPIVHRLRPCHDPELSALIHLVNRHCGGQFGFASSHAANFAGMTAFFGGVFWNRSRWIFFLLFTVSLLVGTSRIYLGVHFPSDIFAGYCIGGFAGLLGSMLFNKLQLRFNFPQSASK